MKKYVNGQYIELTQEELEQIEKEAHLAAIAERTRPLTESEVSRMLIAQQINTLSVDDNTALRMVEFYPEWATDTTFPAGYKVQHGGKTVALLAGAYQPDRMGAVHGNSKPVGRNLRKPRRNVERSNPV